MTDFSFIVKLCGVLLRYPAQPFTRIRSFIALGGAVEQEVDNNTEDKRAGYGRQRNRADVHLHSTDTCDQDDRCGEKVAVVIQVNRLEHLQTGNGNEAVQRDADTAHDTGGNRAQEGDKRTAEAGGDRQDRCGQDGDHGSIAGDGNAAD